MWMEKWKSTGLFILIVIGVLFVFSAIRTVGICNETEGYSWNSFWGYCEENEYLRDWKCTIDMSFKDKILWKDSNIVVKGISLEIPCNEVETKRLLKDMKES